MLGCECFMITCCCNTNDYACYLNLFSLLFIRIITSLKIDKEDAAQITIRAVLILCSRSMGSFNTVKTIIKVICYVAKC